MQTIQSSRSLTPDLARGFMLLLIAMAYTDAHLGNWGTPANQAVDLQPTERLAIAFKTLFRDNRAYPMFAFLFGYGSVLLFQKLERGGFDRKQILSRLRRRACWLLIFGFFHSVLVFNYEILAPYGIALLITAPLLFKTDIQLKKILKFLIPVFTLMLIGVGFMYALPPETYGSGATATQVSTYWETVINGIINFPMSACMVLGYPIIPLMIIGMLAARKQLLDDRPAHRQSLKRIARVGITVSILGAVPLLLKEFQFWRPTYAIDALAHALHLISGAVGGVGYAALLGVVVLNIRDRNTVVVQAVSALGKRSLTGYLLQSAAIMLIMAAHFGNLGTQLSDFQSALVGLAVWLAAVTFSHVLERNHLAGPFDHLLRKLANRSIN